MSGIGPSWFRMAEASNCRVAQSSYPATPYMNRLNRVPTCDDLDLVTATKLFRRVVQVQALALHPDGPGPWLHSSLAVPSSALKSFRSSGALETGFRDFCLRSEAEASKVQVSLKEPGQRRLGEDEACGSGRGIVFSPRALLVLFSRPRLKHRWLYFQGSCKLSHRVAGCWKGWLAIFWGAGTTVPGLRTMKTMQ